MLPSPFCSNAGHVFSFAQYGTITFKCRYLRQQREDLENQASKVKSKGTTRFSCLRITLLLEGVDCPLGNSQLLQSQSGLCSTICNRWSTHSKLVLQYMVPWADIDTVQKINKLGYDQYDIYVSKWLVNQTKHIDHPIMRNNLPLFS